MQDVEKVKKCGEDAARILPREGGSKDRSGRLSTNNPYMAIIIQHRHTSFSTFIICCSSSVQRAHETQATMFAAATSFFARTNISQNYTIGSASSASSSSRTSTPAPTPVSAAASTVTVPPAPTFRVGPWRVQSATHKTSGKRVSVWDCDKKSPWMERLSPPARERAVEVLKMEVCLHH